ncbi:MAG: DeoR family transcriptional regulator, partial [Candidatus Spechtbacterales bacterium]
AQDGLPFRSSERAEDGKNNDSVTSLNNERNPEHRPEHRPELAEGPVEGPRQASYAPPAGGPLYAGIYTGVEEAEEPHVELADERSPEHRPESVEGLAEGHAGSSLDIPERREKNYIQNSENVLKSASVSEAGNAKSLVSEFGEYAGAPRVSDDPGPLKATRARSEGSPLTDRHETILTHLGNNGAVQVADLSNILQDISPRTIRRDLDKLIKMGKVTKHGKTNGAKYRLA